MSERTWRIADRTMIAQDIRDLARDRIADDVDAVDLALAASGGVLSDLRDSLRALRDEVYR